VATFDVLHSRAFIEHLAGDRINARNAEHLLCKAVGQVLDLVRHFAVPDRLEPRVVSEDSGFAYRYDWWTGHVIQRPTFASTREIEQWVQRDIEAIYGCIQRGQLCRSARQHVWLFDENFETFEELKSEYRRLIHKLDGPLMLPPEDVAAVGVAVERYDESNWWYLWYDYPATARRYLDALTDYQLAFIAMKVVQALMSSDIVAPEYLSVDAGTSFQMFYDKRAWAQWYAGEWLAGEYIKNMPEAVADGTIGVANVPIPTKDANPNIFIGGPGQCYALSANSKHPDVTIDFAKVLSTPDVCKLLAQNDIHLAGELADASTYTQNKVLKLFMETYAKADGFVSFTTLVPDVLDHFKTNIGQMMLGKMGPEEFLKDMDARYYKG
jgi:hypothetical protein